MKSSIAGVSPATERETTIMTVWPSIAATGMGQWWGRRFRNDWGLTVFGIPMTLGRLTALASIPFVLPVYFHMLVPRLPLVVFGWPNPACRRYRLTNRRVVVEQPFGGGEQQSVSLDRFDSITTVIQPGQEWYPAADLVFRNGQIETFRLLGVPHPEGFRHACLKARQGFVGVEKARLAGFAAV